MTHADGCAGERARHAQLVEIDRKLLRAGEHDHGRAADDDRDRHFLPAPAVLQPVQIAARPGRLARHHAHRQPVGRLQRRPIRTHVLDPRIGIARDAQGRREVGRSIEARRRDRHRQARQPAAGRAQVIACDDHLLAARRGHGHRRDRMRDRLHPCRADVFHRPAHADAIDVGRGGHRADDDRHVVAPPLRVDHVGEQERAPLLFRHAAEELPAHERMQLGILVDRPVDADKEAIGFEIGQMLLEIEPRPSLLRSRRLQGSRFVEHVRSAFHTGARAGTSASS